jgi:Beta-lactamase
MITSRTGGLPRFSPIAGDNREWGLGFCLHETTDGRTRYRGFGHGAWSGCQWWMYPELDRCLVLMTNLIDAPRRGVLFDELHSAVVADA